MATHLKAEDALKRYLIEFVLLYNILLILQKHLRNEKSEFLKIQFGSTRYNIT